MTSIYASANADVSLSLKKGRRSGPRKIAPAFSYYGHALPWLPMTVQGHNTGISLLLCNYCWFQAAANKHKGPFSHMSPGQILAHNGRQFDHGLKIAV